MNKYRICVYAICKNEEKFVDRWMNAVNEADLVVVLDTGSTDQTVEKLRSKGAMVYTEAVVPWRFDTARNLALSHIPEDVDICVSTDMDEVFEPKWREKLEAAWQPCHTRARYLFTCSFNTDGSPKKQYAMEKIHRRKDFRWVHPVHEILQYFGNDSESSVFVPNMVLNHYPDITKPRTQYLPLLELSAKENPMDDRIAFWLGREYMYYKQYDKCIAELKRHLMLPSAIWDEERSASMRFIAKSYQNKNDFKEAKLWFFRAIAECPRVREPYLYMARLGYLLKDWPLVLLMTDKALDIKNKSGSYLMEPVVWEYELYDLAAISCYRLELYEKSHDFAVLACQMSPENKRLKNNLELIDLKLNEKVGQ